MENLRGKTRTTGLPKVKGKVKSKPKLKANSCTAHLYFLSV